MVLGFSVVFDVALTWRCRGWPVDWGVPVQGDRAHDRRGCRVSARHPLFVSQGAVCGVLTGLAAASSACFATGMGQIGSESPSKRLSWHGRLIVPGSGIGSQIAAEG